MGEEDALKPTDSKKKKGVRLSWWLLVLAVVVFAAVVVFFNLIKTGGITGSTKVKKADTTEEKNIQQTISSMRGDVVRYFEAKNTYVGWAPTDINTNRIKTLGSELKTKLTATTYMVYAKLPSSKLYFCIDNKFTGQVEKIGSKSCQ